MSDNRARDRRNGYATLRNPKNKAITPHGNDRTDDRDEYGRFLPRDGKKKPLRRNRVAMFKNRLAEEVDVDRFAYLLNNWIDEVENQETNTKHAARNWHDLMRFLAEYTMGKPSEHVTIEHSNQGIQDLREAIFSVTVSHAAEEPPKQIEGEVINDGR